MRMLPTVFAIAALVGAALLVAIPARAAGGASVKATAPLLRAGGAVATGQGFVAVSAKGTKVSVEFSVAKLPASVAAPLGVFVEEGVGAGTFTQAASIAALKKGAGKVALSSASGPPAALGVTDLAELVGRAVEIRSGDGTAVLAAKFPALEKFVGTKVATSFGPSQDSPLAKLSAKLTGTPSAKTGSEKFLLKAKGLAPGTVYALWMEDAPGSGVFVAVGDLVGGQFLRDQAKGDTLPFGAASLADLVGRAVELRDSTGPVGRGTFPLIYLGMSWPQTNVFIIDEPGSSDRYLRYVTGVVVYRSQVDLTATSIAELIAEGEADWRLDPKGSVPGGLVCTVRLDDDDRYWWQVGSSGGQHYLGMRYGSSPPSNLDDGKFILRFDADVDGHRTARIESFRFPGEFLVNAGHILTANGIRFSSTETPVTFILR